MGLDMYLEARRFLWTSFGEGHRGKDDDVAAAIRATLPDMGDLKPTKVVAEAAYWRKANHIHKWFVDNVQEGNDDCGYYNVGREQLTELADLCHEVMEDQERAGELLPTADGFFFGVTKYGEYYYEQTAYTRDRIRELLGNEDLNSWEFYYHSSW
jgi:hypothetical protein